MSVINLPNIEQRITEVEASYTRQLALAGKAGYDPALTELLKKDLEWLMEQRNNHQQIPQE